MNISERVSSAQPSNFVYPENAPAAFHLLAKPSGPACNLDCAYCFFLDKAQLYPGSNFRMSEKVLEQYIKQLIEAHRVDRVLIAWQGGEPTLMGLDFYHRAMEIVEKYRRQSMSFLHTIQTNATLHYSLFSNYPAHAKRSILRLLRAFWADLKRKPISNVLPPGTP
jgi:sulfatase maturation enzyme AslB (radical SAM superfamily)